MKIGLIGCGNIGKFLLKSLNHDKLVSNARIAAIYGRNPEVTRELAEKYETIGFSDVNALIQSDVDLLIEAATVQAVRTYAPAILKSGKDLLLISVGALADQNLYHELKEIAVSSGSKIYLPSGAVGGLDVLKAAMSTGGLASVSITTRKPSCALPGAPMDEESILFEGTAADAIALFPQNINVSIILSLAGLGPENTSVKIIADPQVTKNQHCIEATGSFGKLTLQVENHPMPNNPKTSYLAALSILSTLKNRNQTIIIG